MWLFFILSLCINSSPEPAADGGPALDTWFVPGISCGESLLVDSAAAPGGEFVEYLWNQRLHPADDRFASRSARGNRRAETSDTGNGLKASRPTLPQKARKVGHPSVFGAGIIIVKKAPSQDRNGAD